MNNHRSDDESLSPWLPLGLIAIMILLCLAIWGTMGHRANINDGPAAVWRKVN